MKKVINFITLQEYESPYYRSQEHEDAWKDYPNDPDNPKNWKKDNTEGMWFLILIFVIIYIAISYISYTFLTFISRTFRIMKKYPVTWSIILKIISFIIAPIVFIIWFLDKLANAGNK